MPNSPRLPQEDLQRWVEVQSLRYFQRPFRHQARWNTLLRSSGGRYNTRTHQLDFNPKILQHYDLETFNRIIRHELCHYHLHLTHRGYRHRDADFKALLQQVEGARYAPPLPENRPQYDYQCQRCQQHYWRRRRMDTRRYRCSRCGGALVLRTAPPNTEQK